MPSIPCPCPLPGIRSTTRPLTSTGGVYVLSIGPLCQLWQAQRGRHPPGAAECSAGQQLCCSFAHTAGLVKYRVDQSVPAMQLLSCDQMTAYLKRLQGSQEAAVSTQAAVNLQAPAPGMMLLKKKEDDLLDTMFAGATLGQHLACAGATAALAAARRYCGCGTAPSAHPAIPCMLSAGSSAPDLPPATRTTLCWPNSLICVAGGRAEQVVCACGAC
jgi:hypothetical protein